MGITKLGAFFLTLTICSSCGDRADPPRFVPATGPGRSASEDEPGPRSDSAMPRKIEMH